MHTTFNRIWHRSQLSLNCNPGTDIHVSVAEFVPQNKKACDLSRLFDLNLSHARKSSKCPLEQLHLTPELWFKHGSKFS